MDNKYFVEIYKSNLDIYNNLKNNSIKELITKKQ